LHHFGCVAGESRSWLAIGVSGFPAAVVVIESLSTGSQWFSCDDCLSVASALGLHERYGPLFPLCLHLLISAFIYAGGYGICCLLIALFFEHRLNGYALNSAILTPFDSAWPATVIGFAFEPVEQLVKDSANGL
tara:strand:+ start:489 stop:890 length:402 start_codon:yes stop_codon:yes gene_type:complete